MDTGTHFVMGMGLGALSTLDPVVAASPTTAQTVLLGTIIGSQIPDIDTVLKLRNNAIYIRNHRGITHSIPAVLLWPVLVTAILYMFNPSADLLHIWLWTFLAVFLHVFVDIFNAYGTQALRPISSKWVALGIINTFDPFIFGIHVAGLILWTFGSSPGYTFLVIYGIMIVYYIIRFREQRLIKAAVKKVIPEARKIILSPTMRFHKWRVAVITEKHFYVARANNRSITILDQFKRVPLPEHKVLDVAKHDKNLAAFLSFSPVYRWEIEENNGSYEVRFIDLRYRSNGYYPFVAVVQLDHDLNIVSSYTGWIFSEEKLRKKLNILPN
ncbi:metal-dependent hydrolase [Peribacillus tepidiphilus]|uniref:metal-dependent hydrolase n=1 Tax=Peribacillus tepidiphilus TaxID=2652445 RepID=UPI0012922D27|nr:metal-dependent hydrolase [Peribacillus tepidiphilus]